MKQEQEAEIFFKIRQVEHKSTGTLLAVDSILRSYEFTGLKGPTLPLIKKNFDPIIITNSEIGERLIKQSFDVICNFSQPTYANIIPIEPFDHDFETRYLIFIKKDI